MYTTIRNTALAMVACFSASTNPPLIITRGAGGDASGATVIHDNWRHGTPDLINLTLKSCRFFLNRMMPIKLSMRRIILIPGV
ncbi:hypothetical protein EU383_15665 [Salmonella enterica subsp. enterica serovar Napoli]|uniref:Uncharacterized protein n=1 Tax=Salmonella enterica subsp. enterica serovar Napoli TaxID=1151001 RepID=A0A5I4KCS9_SALET|nr:hypothetical protein [Salmonella enterica subsp. enterica serovar Napoli]MDN78960.1 hypothetical protein [Salmonella enterica]EBR8621476.1 hypothetical protein [Salmonella enterica subsp. enterica serovar Napoli]EBU7220628.1 hypothetical protein [Salmonella enterica subsp. enterica serovar Napoli]EBU8165000.1 hypothetical protein [Salmonella enterica subsp. enterica serovar Napoli]